MRASTSSKTEVSAFMEHGLFSEIDIHFAGLMKRLSRQEDPAVSLAAALASLATSKGHTCVNLSSAIETLFTESLDPGMDFPFPDISTWRAALLKSGVVGTPGEYRPMILDDASRLYLYRYWEYEKTLADDLIRRSAAEIEDMDLALLGREISRLFGPPESAGVDHRKLAAFIASTQRFCVITGGPGTGKTSVLASIVDLAFTLSGNEDLCVALAAPTGKASARIQEAFREGMAHLPDKGIKIKNAAAGGASTIHRLLGTIKGSPYFRHNRDNPLPHDVVAVDEASMVDLPLLSKLVQALRPEARLILLGDKDQISSVEPGAVLGDICGAGRAHNYSRTFSERYESATHESIEDASRGTDSLPAINDCVVHLTKSYRFGNDSGIGALSAAINDRKGEEALALLKGNNQSDITFYTGDTGISPAELIREEILKGYGPFLRAAEPVEALARFSTFRILTVVREGTFGQRGLNRAVERTLSEKGLIRTDRRWYAGRPVLITRNNERMGLYNGDTGIIMPDAESNGEDRAFFISPEGTLRQFPPAGLPEHETAFAVTVHKSQGSEYDRVLLVLPSRPVPVLTGELIYTAVTRAKKRVAIFGKEDILLQGIHRRMERSSGLRDLLWSQDSPPGKAHSSR